MHMFDGGTRQTWIFSWTTQTNGTWTHIVTKNSPPARQHYAMSSTGGGKKVILFGGEDHLDATQLLSDTWKFDSSIDDWTVVLTSIQ